MRRIIIQLAIVSTALAVIGPALAAPRSATVTAPAPAPDAASPAEATAAAAQTEGLCGLTQADVVAIVDHYDLEPDWAAFAKALEVPFNCDAYGDLCAAVGETEAESYACRAWHDLRDATPIELTLEALLERLRDHALLCTGNENWCEAFCEPNGVYSCDGVVVQGDCRSVAVCNSRWRLPFIEAFRPVQP